MIACNQLTNHVFKFRETYHTENIESRETERGETEKLSTEIEKQINWALMEAHKKGEVILEEKRQKYLGASSRNQQSPQLTEMDQPRDCRQTWSSL